MARKAARTSKTEFAMGTSLWLTRLAAQFGRG